MRLEITDREVERQKKELEGHSMAQLMQERNRAEAVRVTATAEVCGSLCTREAARRSHLPSGAEGAGWRVAGGQNQDAGRGGGSSSAGVG